MDDAVLNILLAESKNETKELFLNAFKHSSNFFLTVVNNLQDIKKTLSGSSPDIVIANQELTDGQGITLVTETEDLPNYPLVLLTENVDTGLKNQLISLGATDVIGIGEKSLPMQLPQYIRNIYLEWRFNYEAKKTEEATYLLKGARVMTQHTLKVQEEERKNIAREIHDEIGQYLTAIKTASILIKKPSKDKLPECGNLSDRVISLVEDIYGMTRRIQKRLRPEEIDHDDLSEVLSRLIHIWNKRHFVPCSVEIDDSINFIKDPLKITMYRILQKCLNNIAKHASANNVSVKIHVARSQPDMYENTHYIMLIIKDDGVGMDLKRVQKHGMGLLSIRERVKAVSGDFKLDSNPDKGATLSIFLPIHDTDIEQNYIAQFDQRYTSQSVIQ